MSHNKFDKLSLDVERIKQSVLSGNKRSVSRFIVPKLALVVHAVIFKTKRSKEFIYSFCFTKWFVDFQAFWYGILDGRPIDMFDFHFLRQQYRTRFQDVGHTNEMDSEDFLEAWNTDENIYLLFGSVWKYAKTAYLNFLPTFFHLPKKGKVLEYGCGIAPYTTGALKYFPRRGNTYEIADIPQINFLYAIYQLGGEKDVSYRFLGPHNNLVEEKGYSAIICQTVLEHISNPLEVVKSFHRGLQDGGVLVFDYIKGDGDGLDSMMSVHQREETLRFIQEHFQLVRGQIDPDRSVSMCVVKKKALT